MRSNRGFVAQGDERKSMLLGFKGFQSLAGRESNQIVGKRFACAHCIDARFGAASPANGCGVACCKHEVMAGCLQRWQRVDETVIAYTYTAARRPFRETRTCRIKSGVADIVSVRLG